MRFIGMFSMKVAAYLQPFTDKLITKKGRLRRWEALMLTHL